MPKLTGIFQKIDRSLEHLNTLNESVEGFFEEHGDRIYIVRGETNSQRTKHLLRPQLLVEFPLLYWGIIVGDAVHCLRSALDQLAYTLSLSPNGDTAFPICTSEKDWVTKAPAMTWGIPKPLIAAIDQSQPYHRGDAANSHPLALLRGLSNTDKHREIPVTALIPSDAEFVVRSTKGIASYGRITLKSRIFEDGAVFAEVKIVPDDSGLEPEMQMDGVLTFQIVFGRTGVPSAIAGKPLMPAFKALGEAVQQVILDISGAAGEVPTRYMS